MDNAGIELLSDSCLTENGYWTQIFADERREKNKNLRQSAFICVLLPIVQSPNLAFDSQICGGKRYDLATMGRRRAHATYHESHGTDVATGMIFAMDLTPLIQDAGRDIPAYVREFTARFVQDVMERLVGLQSDY